MKKLNYFILLLILLIPFRVNAAKSYLTCDSYNPDTKTCSINICNDGCRYNSIPRSDEVNQSNYPTEILLFNILDKNYEISQYQYNYDWANQIIISGNGATTTCSSENEDPLSNYISFSNTNVLIKDITLCNRIIAEDGSLMLYNVKINKQAEEVPAISTIGIKVITLNEVTASGIFISVEEKYKNGSVIITNSDLTSDDSCSIVFKKAKSLRKLLTTSMPTPTQGQMPSLDSDYDVIVSNSKINCAICSTTLENASSRILIDSTNTWTDNRIERGTEGNVVEEGTASIIIEKAKEKEVKITATEDLDINKYFEDIPSNAEVDWEIEDETIAVIRNNKIVPLKVGSTTIVGELNNNIYTLRLDVTEDMINPTPTPTVTPTPTATPVPTNDVEVPNTYEAGIVLVIFAFIMVLCSTYYFVHKEEE